ncbi:MAG: hypothetical protein F6K18_29870 [Okeania sp. SIO2C2]|uniref:hypothetical protein n=1 Tax=Okeania sp. SIO2C2 TaxID=2607787 RepID=UPI0013BE6C76|nr:hypothetical protein [Okeania sp. SIO2C2]NEP90686.1 hypothetical protein [Okeania sp. SIO2C2]
MIGFFNEINLNNCIAEGRRNGEMGRWGDGDLQKYLVMVEDGTFFYTELNAFDIRYYF